MKDLMIDIETLGQEPGCVITSISAVQFDLTTGKIDKEFHENISINSCLKKGLVIESETFIWWLDQPEIKKELDNDRRTILHNGLSDCKHQIIYVSEIYRKIKNI
jgi:hypothetical protein